MSDQINSFDEVFREKLSEHTISPPEFVWDKIESQRSFGHIVANKISINWRTFGTMLLLLLGGGGSAILFGGEEHAEIKYQSIPDAYLINLFSDKQQTFTKSLNTKSFISISAPDQTAEITNEAFIEAGRVNQKVHPEAHIPDLELIASINQAAFTKPEIKTDAKLNSFISHLDGWETASPISFNHYYQLEKMKILGFTGEGVEAKPIRSVFEYDYARPPVSRKSFRERTSVSLSIIPQTITKVMTAEYNLSSSYLRHRESSEQTRMAYTLEANFHYELKKNKFFETGVNFTQIYEEMSFKGEKRFSNQYDFVEVPLLLGYEDRNSVFGFQIKGGFGIQVLNNYSGYIYKKYERPENSNNTFNSQHRLKGNAVKTLITRNHILSQNQDPNEVLNLENEDENPFKKGGVLNFHLSSGFTYYHNSKTILLLGVYYKRNINSITKESALFNERISYMGISFGTRLSF